MSEDPRDAHRSVQPLTLQKRTVSRMIGEELKNGVATLGPHYGLLPR
jgi:hypothetical protein